MKKPYKVNIQETFKKTVDIQAKDLTEALELVQENYHNGDLTFEADDHVDTVFRAEETEH